MKKQEMEQIRLTLESIGPELIEDKRKEISENLEKLSVLTENRYANFFDLALVNSRLKSLINSLEDQIGFNQREEKAEEISKCVIHVGADYEPDYGDTDDTEYNEVNNYGVW